jgi:hypothetical protein
VTKNSEQDIPPRVYAQRILAMNTLTARRAALKKVPAHLRELVKRHIEIAWRRRKALQEG